MGTLLQVLGYGIATGAALAFAVVVVTNWRAALAAIRRPHQPRPSLIFLAGPVLLVGLIVGIRMTGAGPGGAGVFAILLFGLAVDPAALPVVAFAMVRRVRESMGGRG